MGIIHGSEVHESDDDVIRFGIESLDNNFASGAANNEVDAVHIIAMFLRRCCCCVNR
jgi:hypothetical protein